MKKLTNGPTKEMIQAAREVFKVKANTEAIRKVVIAYETQILKDMNKFAKFGPRNTEKVLDPKYSYLLTDKDYKEYADKCNEARKQAGLHVDNEEFCPLLVAEEIERKTWNKLVEAFQPVTGLTVDMLTHKLENYDKFKSLTLVMMQEWV